MQSNLTWELSYYIQAIPFIGGRHLFVEEDIRRKWETARAAGIQWVGFDGVNLFERFEPDFASAFSAIKDMREEFGFKLSSLHFGGPTYAPLDNGQSLVRDKLVEYIETFQAWKPRALVIHAGWIHSDDLATTDTMIDQYKGEIARHGFDAVISTVAENLKAMAIAAQKYSINLAIETMGKLMPLGQKDNMAQLIELVDEPNIGYCLDSGHVHAGGESVSEWVRIAGDRLFETHFHDNRALAKDSPEEFVVAAKIDEHLSPGFGTISWMDVMRALGEINFPGPVTFESKLWLLEDPVESYTQAIAWWRACEKLAAKLGD